MATFCWNNQEHLEAYFGVPAMGAVLHTLNIRLPGAQVAQIVRHAGDRIIIVDDNLVPLLAAIRDQMPTVEAFIVNGPGDASALEGTVPVLRYDDLLADPCRRRPRVRLARTGRAGRGADVLHQRHHRRPQGRGVLAPVHLPARDGGHRPTPLGISEADRALAIVPMFHANAWGLPYAAFLSGADAAHARPRSCRPRT